MLLKHCLKVSVLLNTKLSSPEVLGIFSTVKINPRKKFRIGILENKFKSELISFRQSSLFLQSFLIQSLSLTKICNMIITQFQCWNFALPKKHQKTRDQGE